LVLLELFLNAASCYAANTIVVLTGGDAVANGVNFQTAINAAKCGDTIVLQAGATYQGPAWADQAFFLPSKPTCTGTDFITIQTSNMAGLAADGVRVDPAVHAVAMPKLVADVSGFGMPVIIAGLAAHHYKLIGLEITNNGVKYAPGLVNINPGTGSGPGGYPSYEEIIQTHDFVIDRCFIHAAEINANNLFPSTLNRTAGRGINAEGVNISILNSYIAGFAGRYADSGYNIDSMGIFTVAGPGPIHIVNNYIEAQFNNIFLGGGDNYTLNTATVTNPTMTSATLSNVNNLRVGDLVAFSSKATTPSPWETGQITAINGSTVSFTLLKGNASPLIVPDANGTARWNGININNVDIRRNFLNKPDAWNAFSYPKSFIEIKACVDCVIDGNRMYSGVVTNVAYTGRNQAGSAPWQRIENITYSNNIMTGYGTGMVTLGSDNEQVTLPSGNWIIRNNLWVSPQPDSKFFLITTGVLGGGHDIFISHNTVLNPGTMMVASGVTDGQFVLKDNIVGNGEYGINCLLNSANLQTCLRGLQMTGNVIVGPPMMYRPYCTNLGSAVYPSGNTCVSDSSKVSFANLANGDYRLATSSPFKGKASDGTDPGVDLDALLAAQGASSLAAPVKAVAITSPSDGQTVTGTITTTAEASPDVQPSYVEFYLEGQLAATSSTVPYSTIVDTKTVPNGERSLVAKAFDSRGYVGSSNPVSVTIYNRDDIPPTSSITSPTSGASVSGTITISASASDNVGVTKVEFVLDSSTLTSSSTSSPFSVVVDTKTLSDGAHSLVARAYDAVGNVGPSAPISFTVMNADRTAPITTITSPSSGAVLSGVASVSATASDNIGVTKVEFLVDSVVTSVSTTSPYSSSLDTTRLSNASHTVASRAYDAVGNVGTSAPVTINVNNVPLQTTAPIVPAETTAPTVTIGVLSDRKGAGNTLSATATDNVGVTRVEFYVDGKLLATDTAGPYTANLSLSGPPGSKHTAMAKAYDAAGNVGVSSSISVTKK